MLPKAEIEELMRMESIIAGCKLPDELKPTPKLINHWLRGLKSTPRTLWWCKLEMVTNAYETQQRTPALKSTAEALIKKPTEYDDVEPRHAKSKIELIKQIKMKSVMMWARMLPALL